MSFAVRIWRCSTCNHRYSTPARTTECLCPSDGALCVDEGVRDFGHVNDLAIYLGKLEATK